MNTLFLDVNGTKYEGKCNFLFDQYATATYGTDEVKKNKDDEEVPTGKKVKGSGLQNILSGLLEFDPTAIVDFWDCALQGYREAKPSRADIENAIMTKIDAASDTLPVIKETFTAIDESGFFKQDVKKFLKTFTLAKRVTPLDETERQQQEIAMEMVEEALSQLGITLPTSN